MTDNAVYITEWPSCVFQHTSSIFKIHELPCILVYMVILRAYWHRSRPKWSIFGRMYSLISRTHFALSWPLLIKYVINAYIFIAVWFSYHYYYILLSFRYIIIHMYNLSPLKHTKIDKEALGHAFRLSFVYFNDFDAIFLADDFDFTQECITRFKNICSYDFVFIFVVICRKTCAIIHKTKKPKSGSSSLNSDFFYQTEPSIKKLN